MKIGLTGGIGSGKSLVAEIFNHLGVQVFNADRVAADILNNDPSVHRDLVTWLGEGILAEGRPDRRLLASIVFAEPEKLARLNSLIHPGVMRRFINWCGARENEPYILHEAAILFETGFYRHMDKNILVTSPVSLRIKRVMERDRVSAESVTERMKNQWPDEAKTKLADFVVENDERTLLVPKILEIHNKLIDK